MIHTLKIMPEYFQAVIEGRKPFEVRKNDRDFQAGDEVVLKEFIQRISREECPYFENRDCEAWQELDEDEETCGMYGQDEAIDVCGEDRARCGAYYLDKYSGRVATVRIKEVFRLPNELSEYVAFTFELLNFKQEPEPYQEVVEVEG